MSKQAIKEKPKSDEMASDRNTERTSTIDEMFGETTKIPERKPEEPERRLPGEAGNHAGAPDEDTDKLIDQVLDEDKEGVVEEKEIPNEEPEKKDDVDPLDVDFDKEPDAEEKEEPVEIDDKDLDDKSKRSIATMRNQLQKAGRRAKDAENALKERDLEVARLQKELSDKDAELQSPKRAAADPMSNPEIKTMRDSIMRERDSFTALMPTADRAEFTANFEGMLRDFADIQNSQNPEARDALLTKLNDRVGGLVEPDMVKDTMLLLSKNHGNFTDILQKIENFGDMADDQIATERVSGWDKQSTVAMSSIDSIINMDDEVIEANPHTPTAFVAKMIRDDPAYAKRAEQAKLATIESFYGKRPLTSNELQKLKDGEEIDGIKASDFLKEREKKISKAREAAMKRQFLVLMMGPKIPKMLQDIARLSQKESAHKEEVDALLDVTKPPKKASAPKEEKPVRAQDRPSAVGGILDVM